MDGIGVISCTVKFRVHVRCYNWEKRGRVNRGKMAGKKGLFVILFLTFLFDRIRKGGWVGLRVKVMDWVLG